MVKIRVYNHRATVPMISRRLIGVQRPHVYEKRPSEISFVMTSHLGIFVPFGHGVDGFREPSAANFVYATCINSCIFETLTSRALTKLWIFIHPPNIGRAARSVGS